jgi:hypothetical protein
LSSTSRQKPKRRAPRAAEGAAVNSISGAPVTALAGVPPGLRDPLLAALNEITTNFSAHKWEPSELNGGKLCETTYTILRSHVDGKWAAKPTKPKNMVDACKAFESADKVKFPQSVRITTPRVIVALYEIRNNRGVGHAGSDVDPNHMDATFVLAGAKWLVAELVRLFHNVSTAEATAIVESLVERVVPTVWTIGSTKRVLVPGLSMKDKTLLLLYGAAGWIPEGDLVAAIEHSNPSVYRRDVLVKAHKGRLIEYDGDGRRAHITPLGIDDVEKRLAAHLVA